MAYNNYQQVPFWDFIRGFEQQGAGVDRPAGEPHPFFDPPHNNMFPGMGPGFPHGGPFGGFGGHFGGPFDGPGRRGHGRRGCRNRDGGEGPSTHWHPGNDEHTGGDGEPREGEATEGEETDTRPEERHRGPRGFHGRGGHGHRGRGGWGHAHHGHHGPRGPRGPPPFGQGGPGAFNLAPLFEALHNSPVGQQPWVAALRNYAQQAGLGGDAQESGEINVPEDDSENSFIPPVDIFSTETSYILHIALPGAKKEDVGVNWDSDKGVLNLAGVVYRQGDEEFLKTLSKSERKVGVFERAVKLPPGEEEKEEVDGDAITAKLEDGVLVVTVPKVEKEWTEVKRVDIE